MNYSYINVSTQRKSIKYHQYFSIKVYICHGRLITVSSQSVEKVSFCSINSPLFSCWASTKLLEIIAQKIIKRILSHAAKLKAIFICETLCVACWLHLLHAGGGNTGFGKMDCGLRQPGYYFPPIQVNAFFYSK